jgi:NitT/TauT family transport system substrate-binding protein
MLIFSPDALSVENIWYWGAKMKRFYTFLLMLAIVCLQACNPAPQSHTSKPPLRFAHNLWPGYFPITIAKAKGFFKEQGVDVEIVFTEDQQPQIAAFYAGKYDGLALPLGSIIIASGNNPDIRVVYVIDDSVGGDAVVARSEIETIQDLKGKTIGATLGGFGELFVESMLQKAGLNRNDITLINTDSNHVPEWLASNRIQAGQAWEPYVSRAIKDGGRLLFSSEQTPGLIIDTIMFRGAVLRERPEDVRAFIRACFQAVDYWKAHPEEVRTLLAQTLKIQPEEISLKGIKLLQVDDNRRAFDRDNLHSLYHNARRYAEFYIRTGSLGRMPDIDKLIDDAFLPPRVQTQP